MKARPWTEQEKQILIDSYPTTRDRHAQATNLRLSEQLGRTTRAITNKAWELRLQARKGARIIRDWEQWEIELLEEHAGETPVGEIHKLLSVEWKKQGLIPRTRTAIISQINKMGLSCRPSGLSGEFYTVSSIAQALRTTNFIVRAWCRDKELNKVLKAEHLLDSDHNQYTIKRRHLKQFFITYPGLLDSTRPDMVWLIDVIAGKDYL